MAKTKTPLNQPSLNTIETYPILDIEGTDSDSQNVIKGKAVVIIDPTTGKAWVSANPFSILISDPSIASSWARVQGTSAGNFSIAGQNSLATISQTYLANPITGNWEAQRTPTVYKNVQTAANGSTAIWTSAVGKKWRLMGVTITLGQGTTAAAGVKVSLLDVAADTGIGVTISVGALAAVPNEVIILALYNLGNGILAAATNTALNVNLSSAMAVNGVSVQVWGTEE